MKQYPKIPVRLDGGSEESLATKFWGFDKLDGSNIRIEWNNKRGFCKFGTRKKMFDASHPTFGKVLTLASELEAKFSARFKELNIQNAVCFFEFHGPNSFAGWHEYEDDHRLTLLDISLEKKGIIEPDEFLDFVKGTNIEIPKVLIVGKPTPQLLASIENGTLSGMTFEGVVFKAKRPRKWAEPVMYKVKNKAWIEKVREKHGNSPFLDDLL